jgi:hypothetical protein
MLNKIGMRLISTFLISINLKMYYQCLISPTGLILVDDMTHILCWVLQVTVGLFDDNGQNQLLIVHQANRVDKPLIV